MRDALRRMAGTVAAAGLGLALAACETRVETPSYADITFAHKDPIALDVAAIEIVPAYEPTRQPPNVETEFPVGPLATAERWAEDRLRAVGDAGTATFTVRDASVVERRLETNEGFTNLFTTEQSEKYDARYLVTLEAVNPDSQSRAGVTVEVNRTRTVAEDLTYNEREEIWYRFAEDMAEDLDRRLEREIAAHFGPFLVE